MNTSLYIFKYSALDNNNQINDFFIAENMDECRTFLNMAGYTNIAVSPLKPGEATPDINRKIDLDTVSVELGNLSNNIKHNVPLVNAVVDVAKRSAPSNRSIYFRIAYFVYKGDSLSVAMRKLGKVIPDDIIENVRIGEASNSIPKSLRNSIKKYAKVEKTNFFGSLFRKKEDVSILDSSAEENLKGIESHKRAKMNSNLYPFKYKAELENGKKVSGFFDAESVDDCKHFLEIQGYTNIVVEPRKNYDIEIVLNKKIKTSELAFDLTQLSTYIKAGIPLVEGVTILAKQTTSAASKNAYQKLVYDLLKGDALSTAMEKQGNVFPQLLINMVRSAEMTGDLPTILDDMADYYESIEQTKKAMRSAMTYPLLVLILAIAVLAFMLLELVPQFVTLYENNGATLPKITLTVIAASNFMVNNYVSILLVSIFIIVAFIICYKKVPTFRRVVQLVVMKLPGFGNIIIYNEVYNFTKTFSSLINHGVFITDSMEILSKITNNEIYKEIIAKTLSNLAKGETISKSFKGEWAFPTVAYHMLVTGENTGQLGLMMEKVSDHYQQLHKSMVDQLKSLIEPIMILMVAFIVGIILLSIITPMFDIYNQIQ